MRTLGIVICLLFSNAISAEIFKWVDEQGVTHYGEKPPENRTSKRIELRSDPLPTSPAKTNAPQTTDDNSSRLEKQQKLIRALSDDRKQKQEQREKEQRMAQQRIRNCAVSKDNLRRYESSSAVYQVDDQGRRVVLPSSERDKSIQRAHAEVQKWCGE